MVNDSSSMAGLTFQYGIDFSTLQQQVEGDPELSAIVQALHDEQQAPLGYTIDREILVYNGRFVLPKNSPFIPLLLHEFHNSPAGGHSGSLKTFWRLIGFGRV